MKPRCARCEHLYKEHYALMSELEDGRIWTNRTGHCWVHGCRCEAWRHTVEQQQAA